MHLSTLTPYGQTHTHTHTHTHRKYLITLSAHAAGREQTHGFSQQRRLTWRTVFSVLPKPCRYQILAQGSSSTHLKAMSSAKRKERYINLNGPAVSLASSGCAPWLRIWQLHVLRISQNKSNNTRLQW